MNVFRQLFFADLFHVHNMQPENFKEMTANDSQQNSLHLGLILTCETRLYGTCLFVNMVDQGEQSLRGV